MIKDLIRKDEINKMVFDASVLDVCTNLLSGANCQKQIETRMGSPKYLLIFGESGGTSRLNADEVSSQCDLVAEREAVYIENSQRLCSCKLFEEHLKKFVEQDE